MNTYQRHAPKKRLRLGPVAQKILLLLAAGITISLTQRPDHFFHIIEATAKEWQRINRRSLRKAIRRLYQSQLIDCRDNPDGTATMTLSANGKNRVLRYSLENMRIKKPTKWDGHWRIVIFDVPEYKKQARDALAYGLKNIGMLPIQKSVFVCPYECRDEITFISETFHVKPHVRFIVAKEIDIEMDLKQKFHLSS